MFQLSEIAEIKEIASRNYLNESGITATEKVNNLLKQGWKLLKIYTTCYDHAIAPNQQTIHYVLGIPAGTKQASEDFDKGLIPGSPQNEK